MRIHRLCSSRKKRGELRFARPVRESGRGGLYEFTLNDTYFDKPCQIISCLTRSPTNLQWGDDLEVDDYQRKETKKA